MVMKNKNQEKFYQFLNSIWLISSVKEWIFRIIFIVGLQLVIISGLSIYENGLTTEVIKSIVFTVGICTLMSVSFIIFLYRKFCLGQLLKNKAQLFKK